MAEEAKAKKLHRWGIERTPEGGVSIGWTSLKTFYRCPRLGFWSLVYGGRGIGLPKLPPNEAMLYGKLWHSGYRASWKGIPLIQGLEETLAEDELALEDWRFVCDEVIEDLDWYFSQTRGLAEQWEVLACEQELRLKLGRHLLRGTPDLVARSASGSVVMPDHKTFGVLSYTSNGTARITPEPKEQTINGYITSRQFPFYAGLWNRQPGRKEEDLCFDALLNLVPSHITTVNNILASRKGEPRWPQIRRLPLEPYAPSYVDRVLVQAERVCDAIAEWWDNGEDLDDALARFNENEAACVGWGGSICQYYELDTADDSYRAILLDEGFERKD
jgi:hypothetical protein